MIKDKLMEDLKIAMKNKLEIHKNTIQSLRAEILKIEKDKQVELTDAQIIEIIMKEKKKREDTLEMFKKANRKDLIDQTNEELEVIFQYIPKQLTNDELRLVVNKWIAFYKPNEKQNFGAIIGKVKEETIGQADGKRISELVKELVN